MTFDPTLCTPPASLPSSDGAQKSIAAEGSTESLSNGGRDVNRHARERCNMAPKQTKSAAKKTTTAATRKRASKRFQAPAHDAIAERAYFLYLSQNGGDDVSHWLQAERQLMAS